MLYVLNKRTANVTKPYWTDDSFDMSQNMLYMLIRQKALKRHIQKIIIEVDKPTRIGYVILPGRWINRLYDTDMMRRGTL